MTFKDVPIGATFEFIRTGLYANLARGPWVKLSARTYKHKDTGMQCEVGSINVEIGSVWADKQTNND